MIGSRPLHPTSTLRLHRTLGVFGLCALLWASIPPVALAHGAPQKDGAVTLIDLPDPETMTLLRSHFDVWGPRRDAGQLVLWADAAERQRLEALGLAVTVDHEATAALLAPRPAQRGGGIPGFSCYRTVPETFASLAQLAVDHPGVAEWVDIGDSWEKIHGPGAGFDIHALVLTNESLPGPKPPLMVMSAMHAREYATAELATRFAEGLATGYGTDPEATWVLDHHEVHIVPQLNPDGRTEAEGGAFWRKNVNNDHCSNSSSRGIDLNRNSSFLWNEGTGGASSGSSCSEVYRGPSAGSEPETQALEAYMAQVFADQRGELITDAAPATAEGIFISIHSFGELVLLPWEATATNSPNHTAMQTLGRKFGFYTGHSVCVDCLGTADGTSVDQAYGEYGVASYTFEIGTAFFQDCDAFNASILPDNLDALRFAAKSARRPYQDPGGPEVLNAALDSTSVGAGTAVTLTATADDSRFASGGFGTEPTQTVAAAYASFDEPPWDASAPIALTAVDGAFDGGSEAITGSLDTTGLPGGRHLVYVWAEDSQGQRGVPTAVFLDIEGAFFEDGFEGGDTSAWLAVGE